MTEEQRQEALNAVTLLDRAAELAPLGRQNHVRIQAAVALLVKFVSEVAVPDSDAPEGIDECTP